MPTSASTGTKQVQKKDKSDEKAAEVAAEGVKPDHAPKAEQTPKQSKGKSELNSPDGAKIKTDPDDVQPGDRADLPPSPPQNEAQPVADHNNSGVIHAVTRQGAHVSISLGDKDWADKLREADPKHPSLPKD